MEGEFSKKKPAGIVLFLIIIGISVFITGKFISFLLVPDITTAEIVFAIIMILFFASFITMFVLAMMINYNAYLYIKDNCVYARYGLNKKLECELSQIEYVDCDYMLLTIAKKNGKKHLIWGLTNALKIYGYICRNIHTDKLDKDILIADIKAIKKKRKKDLITLLVWGVIVFANIFACAALTEWKELNEFSSRQTAVFTIMMVLELVFLIIMFAIGIKAGKKVSTIRQKNFQLKKAIMENTLVPFGHSPKVFVNETYNERLIVFSYPDSENVYYIVQDINKDNLLETVFESEIYEDISELDELLEEYYEIIL